MGACLMQRTSSFFIKLGSSYDLGLRRKWLGDEGTKFLCNMYSRVSATRVSDESDYSTSNSESCSEGECSSSRERPWEIERVEFFSSVGRVVKSLNWRVARRLRFAKAVGRYGFDRSFAAYAMFVNVYANAQLEEEVFALIRDIVSYYKNNGHNLFDIMFLLMEQPGDVKRSSFVASVLMKVFASNRILDGAFDVFLKSTKIAIELDIRCCNFLLKCLAENNEREALLAVFQEMKNFGPFPTVYTYTIVMKFYCEGNQGKVEIDEATNLLEEMRENRISPSVVTLNTYINGLCRVGEVDLAWRFLQDSHPLNCHCYNSVIHGFVNKGELDKAIYVFDKLKGSGISPDVYSYSTLIEGFCRYGNVEESLSFCQEMENNGLKPSLVTYTSIIKGLCIKGRMEQSLKVFKDIGTPEVEYDQRIYDTLISGFCAHGHMDKANTLVEEMMAKDLFPSPLCCKSLILGFSKIGSSEKALTFFNLMTQSCAEMPISVVTCNHVIRGFCKERRFEEALQFMYEMRCKGISPNAVTFGLVIDGLCKQQKTERALELIPSMLRCGIAPNVVIYSCLVDGFSKQAELQKALNLFEKMVKSGVEIDVVALATLINVFYNGGMVEKAHKVFDMMLSKGPKPDVFCYTLIIAGFCREKNMEMAWEKYQEMVLNGISPSVVTYTCLMSGFFKVDGLDAVKELLREMNEKMISFDVFAYAVLIRGFQRHGYGDIAKNMLTKMQENM